MGLRGMAADSWEGTKTSLERMNPENEEPSTSI